MQDSKFHLLGKYIANNPTANILYICLNNKRNVHVKNTQNFGFQIITIMKAWEFFCEHMDIKGLIDFIGVDQWKAFVLKRFHQSNTEM